MSATSLPFSGLIVALSSSAKFKRSKSEWSKIIKTNGGEISFMISGKTTHFITTPEEAKAKSSKITSAVKFGTTIVREDFLDQCLLTRRHVDEDPYIISVPSKKSKDPNSRKIKRKREIRVFISSTFLDMSEEREELIKKTFPLLKKLCADRNVQFSYVDLRWGITSEDSSGGKTIEMCLDEIDRCRPYFVCMLGQRYGWSTQVNAVDQMLEQTFNNAAVKYPWIQDYRDRSVTELEILHSTLLKTVPTGLSRSFFYFRSPYYYPTNISESDKYKYESESQWSYNRMKDLKERIRGTNLPLRENYISPQEVANYIYEDLKIAIKRDCPEEREIDPLEFEYEQHRNFAESKAGVYVKKEMHFKRLNDFVRNTVQVNLPMVITGESGVGKSSLLAKWMIENEELPTNNSSPFYVFHFIENSSSPIKIIQRVMNELKHYFQLPTKIPEDEETIKEFSAWLKMASPKKRVVVVLDGIDKVEDSSISDIWNLKWLPQELSPNVRLVLSVSNTGKFFETVQKKSWPMLKLDAFTNDEKTKFAEQYLKQFSKKLSTEQLSLIAANANCASPLFLRAVLEELRVFGSYEKLNECLKDYLQSGRIDDLYYKIFSRWVTDYNTPDAPELVQNTLCLLSAARKGLSELELQDILQIDAQTVWSPFLIATEDTLVKKSGVLSFLHDFLRNVAMEMYGSGSEHYRLAEYFENQPFSTRKLDEYPYHLKITNQTEKLEEFISQPKIFTLLYTDVNKIEFFQYWQSISSDWRQRSVNLYSQTISKYCIDIPSTEKSIINKTFAKYLQELGFFDMSLQYVVSALQYDKSNFGDNSEQVAADMFNLAQIYEKQANYSESLKVVEQLIKLWTEMNPKSLELSDSLNLFALLHKKLGNYLPAKEILSQSLPILESALGSDHYKVALLLNNLADNNRKLDEFSEAKWQYEKSLKILQDTLGPNHMDVAEVLKNLGLVHKKMAEYDTAEPFYTRALSIIESIYGKDSVHPKLGPYLNDLADVHRKRGDTETAIVMYQRALNVTEKIYGSDHPEVAEVLNSMGLVEKKRGNYDVAEKMYRRALIIVEKKLGMEHPKVGFYLCNLADVQRKRSNFKESLEIYERALKIVQKNLGNDHEEVANVLNSMGLALKKCANYPQAEVYYQRSLEILRKVFGDRHPKVAISLYNLADVYRKRAFYDQALDLYSKSRDILTESLGNDHLEVAEVLNCLGLVETMRKKYREAEGYITRALHITEQQLGGTHYKVGMYRNNLGDVYRLRGDASEAQVQYQKALTIIEGSLGEDNVELADVLYNMGLVKNREKEVAKKYWERGLDIVLKKLGEEHPKAKMFRNAIVGL